MRFLSVFSNRFDWQVLQRDIHRPVRVYRF